MRLASVVVLDGDEDDVPLREPDLEPEVENDDGFGSEIFAISTKFVGLAGWVILGAWFVDIPWQWLFGLFPPYWVTKAYWMVLDGNSWWWVALVVGIVTQIGLIGWLAKGFKEMAYRD